MSGSKHTRNTPRRLIKNTVALSLTQVTRIVVNTALTLLVARRLGAEGLGKFAVITAYLQIFQVLSRMGAHRLVVREMARRPDESRSWFHFTVVNQVLGAGISTALMMLAVHLLHHPADTTQALKVATLSLFPYAITSASDAAFQAKEQMGFTALAQITSRGAQMIGSLWALQAGHDIVALAWMIVGSQCLMAVIGSGITWGMGLWVGFRVDLRRAIVLFRQSLDFLIISISSIVFLRLDTLILSQMVGEKAVGVYNAAYMVVRVINFLSSSYSEAAYPVMSRLFVQARARFEMMLGKSLLLGVTATLLIALWVGIAAEFIIDLLYPGKDYTTSVSLLRMVSPYLIVFIWNALLSKGLMAGNLQRYSLIVTSVKLGVGVIYFSLLTTWLGVKGTALATVLAACTGSILNSYFFSRVCALDLMTLVAKPLMVGIITLISLWVARGVAWPGLIAGGTLVYLSLLVVFRILSKEDLDLFWQIIRSLKRGSSERLAATSDQEA